LAIRQAVTTACHHKAPAMRSRRVAAPAPGDGCAAVTLASKVGAAELTTEQRRALTMLAGCFGGGASAPMLAHHKFSAKTIEALVGLGYARLVLTEFAKPECINGMQVIWVHVTEAGRQAVKKKRNGKANGK
jgi:predicted alpha/beta-hydrolase family hydrolase